MDLGSVERVRDCTGSGPLVTLSFQPGRERKLASGGEGGPVGRKLAANSTRGRASLTIEIKNVIMGYYEN